MTRRRGHPPAEKHRLGPNREEARATLKGKQTNNHREKRQFQLADARENAAAEIISGSACGSFLPNYEKLLFKAREDEPEPPRAFMYIHVLKCGSARRHTSVRKQKP